MSQQGTYPIGARILAAIDTLTGVVTGKTADVPLSSLLTFMATGLLTTPVTLGQVQSVNGGQLAGFRNRIINGGMQVAQRGNTAIINGNIIYGGCDRYISAMFGFGSGSGTIQQVQIPGPTTGYWNAIAAFTTTGAGTLGQYHRIEAKNCQDLNNKTITISAKVYQDTGSTLTLTTTLAGATALDTFTSTTTIGAPQAISLSSGVVTPVSYPVTLGASSAANGLQVGFTLAANAHASKNFFVADVQLEIGSVATPFEQRPYGMELVLCQRYFQLKHAAVTTTSVNQNVSLLTQMRAQPTVGTVTFDAGTGATFGSLAGGDGIYQTANHSQVATATVPLTAEI